MEVLRQVLNLIVASLPTTIIVFLFYLFARVAFFKPMLRILDERAARTDGARSDAARLETQSREKLVYYQRAIDKVRVEIFAEQELARRAALDQRAALLHQTRADSNAHVQREKQRLEKELAGAAEQVERESLRLAEETARALLAQAAPTRERVEEA